MMARSGDRPSASDRGLPRGRDLPGDHLAHPVNLPYSRPRCHLATFADTPCDGRLIQAHLIPRQLLFRSLDPISARKAISDPRSWVWACGGPMGNAGHHGMLDTARTLRIPLEAIPSGTIELALELGLDWWLDREYDRG